jgi:hypothetical protein
MQVDCTRNDLMREHWNAANERVRAVLTDNPFDWCLLKTTFPGEEVAAFHLCGTCCKALDANKVPTLSPSNGFKYPPKPVGLPPLDPISARLISPRLPFMQIRRLRYEGNYGIVGQVINAPVDVNIWFSSCRVRWTITMPSVSV